MSVEQTNVVDFIGTSKDGEEVILSIADHLEWDTENKHLLLLQEKLNSYLRFVKSGEIFDSYPGANGKRIGISIYALHAPEGDALEFLAHTKTTIEKAGLNFCFEQREFEKKDEHSRQDR